MREIKFRGRRVDNGEWMFGYYTERMSMPAIMTEDDLMAVKPETVGQFTGLKDKNGVDIYEGDMVKSDALPGAINGLPIKFGDLKFFVEGKIFTDNIYLSSYSGRHLTIIGTIHDE